MVQKQGEILWEKRGHVRIMTLNRPEAMNAINPLMNELQEQYMKEFAEDAEAWVLIITGAGRAFSTGLDRAAVKEMLGSKRARKSFSQDPPEIWKPVIAAIGGYAVGGGCELAMACDIRIAADDARIGLAEVKRAMLPGSGCQRLPANISLGNALMMLFTGDWVDAQEAYRIGLVQKVVTREKLIDEAVALAEKICENGPIALQHIKEAVYRGLQVPAAEGLMLNRLLSMRNRQNAPEDIEEGAKAFAEKRKPAYRGR